MTGPDILLLLFWTLCLAVSLGIGSGRHPGALRFRRGRTAAKRDAEEKNADLSRGE